MAEADARRRSAPSMADCDEDGALLSTLSNSSLAFRLSPSPTTIPSSVPIRGHARMTSPRWASRRMYHVSGNWRRKASSRSAHWAAEGIEAWVLAGKSGEVGEGVLAEAEGAPLAVAAEAERRSGRYIARVQGFILG
jgi:hypothetical protein